MHGNDGGNVNAQVVEGMNNNDANDIDHDIHNWMEQQDGSGSDGNTSSESLNITRDL